MSKHMDFTELEKFLTEVIPPESLSEIIEELTFSHAILIIRLQAIDNDASLYIHNDTDQQLYYLKKLSRKLKEVKSEE